MNPWTEIFQIDRQRAKAEGRVTEDKCLAVVAGAFLLGLGLGWCLANLIVLVVG